MLNAQHLLTTSENLKVGRPSLFSWRFHNLAGVIKHKKAKINKSFQLWHGNNMYFDTGENHKWQDKWEVKKMSYDTKIIRKGFPNMVNNQLGIVEMRGMSTWD